jgi:hypothetical protein
MAPWPTSSIEECSGPVSDFTTAKESSRFTGPTKASMFPWLSLSLQSTRRIGDSDSSGVIAEHWPTSRSFILATMNLDFPNMHDAILESIEIEWESGTTSLRLGLVGSPPPKLVLVFSDVREIHVPREQPWGPSVSVNTVEHTEDDGDSNCVTMRLKMQSGDEIKIRAASLEIA